MVNIQYANSPVSSASFNIIPPLPLLKVSDTPSSPEFKNGHGSSVSETSRRSSRSSLGIPITENKKTAAFLAYENMQDNEKWRLQSGCYVEDKMAELVKTPKYEHPAMYRILDVADENWGLFSSNEELAELNEHAKTPIDYPELLVEMDQF